MIFDVLILSEKKLEKSKCDVDVTIVLQSQITGNEQQVVLVEIGAVIVRVSIFEVQQLHTVDRGVIGDQPIEGQFRPLLSVESIHGVIGSRDEHSSGGGVINEDEVHDRTVIERCETGRLRLSHRRISLVEIVLEQTQVGVIAVAQVTTSSNQRRVQELETVHNTGERGALNQRIFPAGLVQVVET
ncbi:hypothetical protein WICPIJ_004526 [Wickerhamomyces pijperi]|uniref:Uncharacterized protein n=1 Tax=Wickerhamomyces pijperi TaxID=599730 RepID=A0A9P8Q5U2_WICPI|nr:hypothetical protein WICPIJ_004526 [Wickerhamomyces pijperi]